MDRDEIKTEADILLAAYENTSFARAALKALKQGDRAAAAMLVEQQVQHLTVLRMGLPILPKQGGSQ